MRTGPHKNKEGQRCLASRCSPAKQNISAESIPDKYDESVKRERSFLCIGGNSAYRGVQAVIDAWQWEKNGKKLDAKLCIVSNVIDVPKQDEIFWWRRMAEKDLKILQNKCAFHIYPSLTEGFGLAMHESYGVGAQLITTDGPPMNETLHALHLPAAKVGKFNLADLYEVSALDIYNAVRAITPDMSHGLTSYPAIYLNRTMHPSKQPSRPFSTHHHPLMPCGGFARRETPGV